jgi:hypothetical protein
MISIVFLNSLEPKPITIVGPFKVSLSLVLTPGKDDADWLEVWEEDRKSRPMLPAHWAGGGQLFRGGGALFRGGGPTLWDGGALQ